MRKLGIAVGVVVVILILAVAAVAIFFNPNDYRGTIQSELQKRLGRQVNLGQMHLGIFPPRFQVDNIAVSDDPKFNDTTSFVKAQELDVSVKLLPLLHKDVQVSALNLVQPKVELIKNAQGEWNFSTIGSNQQTGPAGKLPQGAQRPQPQQKAPSTPSGQNKPSESQQFSLGKLVVSDGQVAITDQQARKPRTVYNHINVTLKDFSPDTPFTLDASVQLPGKGTQEIRLQGKGGPLQQANMANTPFRGSLDLKSVNIGDLQKFLQSSALTDTDGSLSGHTNISSESGKLAANGQMTLDKPRIHGIDLGFPVVANYDVNDDLVSDLLRINKGNIKFGQTPIDITGTMNSKPTPSQIDMNLRANAVSIAELAKLAAAAGKAFAPGTNVTGTLNANIQARGASDKPQLTGTINGRDIQASGKDIAQPVTVKAVNLNLAPTQIQSDNFPITSGGTTVNTQLTLRNYTSNSPLIDATLKAPNAQLPALLSMAKAYGVSGVDKLAGQGTLNLDLHAAGPVASLSSDQIMRALNGTLALNFNNVKYSGVDINHELASIGGFLGRAGSAQKDQGYTNIQKVTGNILVKNGVAQTNNLQALLDVANVGATGTADLATQRLNLDVTAVLNKAFSQQVGGSNIGGFMNTALANNQGEVVIPAMVTGTFQHPVFAPNVQKIAQMKMKGLLPTGANPLGGAAGGAGGLIGGFLGQKQGNPQQPNAQQQQQNPVNQVLGIFGKKKKK